ncbi:MAG TPA: transporter [Bacteroidales bacterium]|nr:transporter [Bacteroidales bacterium]HPS17297.1 transporter [Bacteroidales bacterium]
MKYHIPILFLLFFMASTHVSAQCCSAGSPIGGDGSNDGLNKNTLRIYTSFKNSLSKDYFHFDEKYEQPLIQKSYFDYSNLSLTYGLSSRFSLHTEIGYFIDKTQEVNINNKNEIIRAGGLGDLAFNIRYIAIKTVKPISQLVISAGTKAPVGAFKEEIDGVTIPISLQPSSGAFKYNASVFYNRKRSERKFGWNSFALFEFSQTINKGFLVYRYGNYFQFSLAGSYSFLKNFNFIGNAKLEWRGKDKREEDIKIESSGSRVVFFNPQLIYTFKTKWSLIAMSDIPVYKYMNGYQLTNKFSFQFGIRKIFSFCKKVE